MVEYDPRVHDLVTLSLHYFEEDALKVGRGEVRFHYRVYKLLGGFYTIDFMQY